MKPDAHEPAVYMPVLPAASKDRGGVEPTAPDSGRTLASPRQIGGEGVAMRQRDNVRVLDGLDEPLRLAVLLDDGVPVGLDEPLRLAVTLDDGVSVRLDELLRLAVALNEGVPVVLLEPEPFELDESVLVWLPVPVELDEGVHVCEPVVGLWLSVALNDGGAVREPVQLNDGVKVGVTENTLAKACAPVSESPRGLLRFRQLSSPQLSFDEKRLMSHRYMVQLLSPQKTVHT